MTDKNYYTALTLMFATTAGVFAGLTMLSASLGYAFVVFVTTLAAVLNWQEIPREVPGAPIEDPRSVLAAARR